MNLEELERLAKEASSGPWVNEAEYSKPRVFNSYGLSIAENMRKKDSIYIAAANPQVILEMIQVIKFFKALYNPCKHCMTGSTYPIKNEGNEILDIVCGNCGCSQL